MDITIILDQKWQFKQAKMLHIVGKKMCSTELTDRHVLLFSQHAKKQLGVHDIKNTTEDDGDYQFNLAVTQPYSKLLNQANKQQVNNMLVMEITSSDQNSTKVQIPKNGQQIEAIGAWVTDNPHGWNELHPIWSLIIL